MSSTGTRSPNSTPPRKPDRPAVPHQPKPRSSERGFFITPPQRAATSGRASCEVPRTGRPAIHQAGRNNAVGTPNNSRSAPGLTRGVEPSDHERNINAIVANATDPTAYTHTTNRAVMFTLFTQLATSSTGATERFRRRVAGWVGQQGSTRRLNRPPRFASHGRTKHRSSSACTPARPWSE